MSVGALAEQHRNWMQVRARLEGVLPPPPKPVRARPVSPFRRFRRAKVPAEWALKGYLFPLLTAECRAHYAFEIAHARVFKPLWRKILEEVAEARGVTVLELLSRRRRVSLVAARHEAMWRMRHETSMSLPEIGHHCGGRDHTTVLWGIRKHEAKLMGKELRRAA